MAIGFDKDSMIQPKNTSHFGFYKDENNVEYSELEDQPIYLENRLGLKELNEKGGLFRCLIEGNHLEMTEFDIQRMIVNFSNHLN